ncbi:MAG: hypothetical protein ACLT2W_11605 [Intestinibacter bartlettii]
MTCRNDSSVKEYGRIYDKNSLPHRKIGSVEEGEMHIRKEYI